MCNLLMLLDLTIRTNKKVDTAEGGQSDNDPPAVPRPAHSQPTPNINPPDPDVQASHAKERTQTRHTLHKQHYKLNEPLPKAQGSKSGSVVLEQPGSCQVTELVQGTTSVQLHERNHSCLASRIKQEGQESRRIPISIKLQERDEVGARSSIFSPIITCSSCGRNQAKTLPSGKVGEGPRSIRGAAWHPAVTTAVAGPMAPQPAGPIPAARHSHLHRHLSHFCSVSGTGGDKGRR